jgi:hypothetical protein
VTTASDGYLTVLEAAVDEAWERYKERAGFQGSSAPYREGFADGLERAMLLYQRHIEFSDGAEAKP